MEDAIILPLAHGPFKAWSWKGNSGLWGVGQQAPSQVCRACSHSRFLIKVASLILSSSQVFHGSQ